VIIRLYGLGVKSEIKYFTWSELTDMHLQYIVMHMRTTLIMVRAGLEALIAREAGRPG